MDGGDELSSKSYDECSEEHALHGRLVRVCVGFQITHTKASIS